ncbi:Hypothetical protein, putative [Bodo saltans]|uniref:SET domain-containing protein n=1 Tax=Bodo saltans TaxID=75058 RepID=A0A0S4JM09_BODSA|nr:Hypothetical protein, putative [Bodo saltans]|eukprot:CUG89529.1 Hypothetical protein, putative [Bodo saltans]
MLTRLGKTANGQRVGVFAVTPIKRGAALYVHDTAQHGDVQRRAISREDALKVSKKDIVTPCVLNLSALPKNSISAMEFMMLRHSWSSDKSFLVHHSQGSLTICPRSCVPRWILAAAEAQAKGEDKQPLLRNGDGWDSKHVDVIPASHLFEVNDAFPWQLPPSEDLANPHYWSKTFKPMWEAYQALTAPDGDEVVGGAAPNVTVTADVSLRQVEDGSSSKPWPVVLPLVKTLRDIDAGEELVGLYGTAWWMQHFLSRLFIAAEDDQMKHVRWIESIFTEGMGGTKGAPFPLLKLCRSKNAPKKLDLADPATRGAATSSGVVAASIRKSCQDHTMLRDTLVETFGCVASEEGEDSSVYPSITPLTQQPISALKWPLIECILRERAPAGGAHATDDGSPPSKHVAATANEAADGGVSL